MSPRLALALALVVVVACGLPAAAEGALTCSHAVGSPGSETTATITIDSPVDGGEVSTPGCSGFVDLRGTWTLGGPAVDYDFYIVIDRSGSTSADSGADVDGDGVRRETADNILRAELAAAQAFVSAVPAERGRFAIVYFGSIATLAQPLSDKATTLATLASLSTLYPSGSTYYARAMDAVELEVTTRGNRAARMQHCLFLSDGEPTDAGSTDAAARELAALGVVMDTFALGFRSSVPLQNMAEITGGTFTPLLTPGDIIATLPYFVPVSPSTFTALQVTTAATHPVTVNDDGTFVVDDVPLVLGPNAVRLTLTVTGAETLTVDCTVTVTLVRAAVADAGPDREACPARSILLDGSRSALACGRTLYRWLDCRGAVVCGTSEDPTCSVIAGDCDRYVLQASCGGEWCPVSDDVRVTLLVPERPRPFVARTCGSSAFVSCGAGPSSLAEWGWDLDLLRDSDGDGDLENDADLIGCDQEVIVAGDRAHVAAWSRDRRDCGATARLEVDARQPRPRPLDGGACPGTPVLLGCGPEAAAVVEWDLDASVDSDGDGRRENDADALGCDVTWPAADGVHDVRQWVTDEHGCRRLAAAGAITVDPTVTPGEAWGLRLRKDSGRLAMGWIATPGADGYRAMRGTLARLWDGRAYDHSVVESAACSLGAPAHSSADLDDGVDAYYLVTATNTCAGEGITGFGWTPWVEPPIPPRRPSPECP